MVEKVLELKNVSFSFGSQPAVKNVTFSMEKGDFLGVIGPNGAGKTTLIKLILGLIKPDSGSIRIFGDDAAKFRSWSRLGYVPQKATNFDQNFPATVFEVSSMGRFQKAGILHQLSVQDRKKIEEALEVVDMLDLRDKRIGDLSGGQQQRVFMARALAGEPELLLLDEPTVGVDAKAQHNFYALLKKLNKEFGMSLILISHDVGMVTKYVNKLACVNITLDFHDVSKGVKPSDLVCAYSEGMTKVSHHH